MSPMYLFKILNPLRVPLAYCSNTLNMHTNTAPRCNVLIIFLLVFNDYLVTWKHITMLSWRENVDAINTSGRNQIVHTPDMPDNNTIIECSRWLRLVVWVNSLYVVDIWISLCHNWIRDYCTNIRHLLKLSTDFLSNFSCVLE